MTVYLYNFVYKYLKMALQWYFAYFLHKSPKSINIHERVHVTTNFTSLKPLGKTIIFMSYQFCI